CYTFEIGDTFGDGIAGSQWGSVDGSCTVKTYNDDLVYVSTVYDYNGSYDFASEQAGMAVTSVNTGITEQTLNEVTNVFPNPFTGQTNLQFSTTVAAKAGIVAYNLVGEQVVNLDLGTLQAGEHNHVLNFAGISAGVYLVALTAGNETTTLRVTLN
ncbi:MAG: T9SS type A sorting domain-containing protein, partial [Flavobacteriales bacterium]